MTHQSSRARGDGGESDRGSESDRGGAAAKRHVVEDGGGEEKKKESGCWRFFFQSSSASSFFFLFSLPSLAQRFGELAAVGALGGQRVRVQLVERFQHKLTLFSFSFFFPS